MSDRRPTELPRRYRIVLHGLLAPWLDRNDRLAVAADVHELRAAYRAQRGSRGLARYTWRQILQYPARLAIAPSAGPSLPAETPHPMDNLLCDLRMAVRSLRRSPLQTATIVAILSLAIGANSAVYSVVSGVLLAPLPYPEPDRLVAVWMTRSDGSPQRVTPGNFADVADLDVFAAIGAMSGGSSTTLTPEDGEPEILQGGAVTGGYFETIGRAPLHGRTFSDEELAVGGPAVTILGHGLWTRRFGADPTVVGKLARFQGRPLEVIGVMPPGIYPTSAALSGTMPLIPGGPDYWVPLRYQDAFYENRRSHILGVVGRLRPDVAFEAAASAVAALGSTLHERDPLNQGEGLVLHRFRNEVVGTVERALMILLLTAVAVLLIASTNVAALLLARAEARQPELAVRAAVGAGRWPLIRLQLAETALLALAGGTIGIAVTPTLLDLLRSTVPTQIPRIHEAGIDLSVMAFTVLVVVATALLSGLLPALVATRPGLLRAVRQSSRAAGVSDTRRRLQSSMVAAQSALAIVLLVVSALLVRSFVQLTTVDLGFEDTDVIAVPMNAPASAAVDWPSLVAFWESVRSRLEAVPGLAAVGLSADSPIERNWIDAFQIVGAVANSDASPFASIQRITPAYFAALRVPVLAGRDLAATDNAAGAPVVVVNETLARTYFAGSDPVGQSLTIPSFERMFGDGLPATRRVVGVVGDVRYLGPDVPPEPAIYLPVSQFPTAGLMALAREDGTRPDSAALVREALREIDRTLAVRGSERLTVLVSTFTANARFSAALIAAFGAIGLALSALGIYALVSRVVSLREREYGIRIAVGAPALSLAGDVVVTAVRPVAVGGFIGLLASGPIAATLRAQLFEITPVDPASYLAAIATLFGVAVLVAALCLRRAIRTDPVVALRAD